MRRIAFLLLAAVSGLAGSFAAEPVKFIGYVALSQGAIVSLVTPDGRAKWCAVGESFEGYTVTEIKSGGTEIVVTDAAKKILTLSLQTGDHVAGAAPSASKTLVPLADLDWKWIKSDKNPMRTRPEDLPAWADDWDNLSDEIKVSLKNYYRAHGWGLEVKRMGPATIHVSNSPLKDPSEPVPTEEERRKSAKSPAKIPIK